MQMRRWRFDADFLMLVLFRRKKAKAEENRRDMNRELGVGKSRIIGGEKE